MHQSALTRLPVLGSLRGYQRGWLAADVFAGLTVAAITVPEDMGYARIAGMPVQAGLYCALVPLLLFVFLGSSRQMNIGADSATAAVIRSGVASLAVVGSAEYVGLVGLLAVLVGGLLLAAGLLRLGMFADLMSRPVLTGFLAGVGIQIALGQVPGMLGIKAEGGFFEVVGGIVRGIPQANATSVVIAAGVIVLILVLERVDKRVPAMLLATVLAIIAVEAFDLGSRGVRLVGSVPAGFPQFGLPSASLGDIPSLILIALAVAFVVLAQATATSQSFAAKNGYAADPNRDLVALGLANIGAGVSRAFPVNGSVSRTAASDGAGGRTQVVGLVSAGLIAIVLLFATDLLEKVPIPALDAIIFLVACRLVKLKRVAAIARAGRRWEFGVALAALITVPILGVLDGIVIAVVLSLLEGLKQAYRPEDGVLAHESGRWRIHPVPTSIEAVPGVVVYVLLDSMVFYNAAWATQRALRLVHAAEAQPRWLVILLAPSSDVDYTSGQALLDLADELAKRDVRLGIVTRSTRIAGQLERYGITDKIGPDAVFTTPAEAVARLRGDVPAPDIEGWI